jgi:hypothetical protein
MAYAAHTDGFAAYLQRTTNDLAMPDHCYEKCKSILDALKLQLLTASICDGDRSVTAAVECLKDTMDAKCTNTNLVDLQTDCISSNNESLAGRRLEEEEEQDVLLMNSTQTPVAETRKLSLTLLCKSAWLIPTPMAPERYPSGGWVYPWCMAIELSKKGGVWKFGGFTSFKDFAKKFAREYAKGPTKANTLKSGGTTYRFSFTWYKVPSSGYSMSFSLQGCIPVALAFGIPKPISGKACVLGVVDVLTRSLCPNYNWELKGKLVLQFVVGLDIWIAYIRFGVISLEIEAGTKGGHVCWFESRFKKKCVWRACDIYIKGTGTIEIAWLARASTTLTYMVSTKWLTSHLQLEYYHWWNGWTKWWKGHGKLLLSKKVR